MENYLEALRTALQNGEDAVLAAVIGSAGSAPRGPGAQMLITPKRVCGTIGGGVMEHTAEQLAREVLAEKRSRTQLFPLHPDGEGGLGAVCGGDVTVRFQYLPAQDTAVRAAAEGAVALLASGEKSWMFLNLTAENEGGLSVYGVQRGVCGAPVPKQALERLGAVPAQIESEGSTYFVQPLVRGGRVYIFGGGHVAQALVPVLSSVDFRCVVLEDRAEFCNPALFPGAEEVRLIDMKRIGDFVQVGPEDFICIMTRGHADDFTSEVFALRTPARYIGLMGSRTKVAFVHEKLREAGFTDADLARVTTPIGLDIQSETPAEIAVSIAAQLICVRAQSDRQSQA